MNFVILDHPRSQLCGSITVSKFGIDPIFPAGDIRFYNFATLAGKCLTTPPFWVFWGFEPLNIVVGHSNPQKAHPWVTKKSITRTGQDRTGLDRTTKKSQKRNLSHIWGKAPRKDIAMKFGTGVDVLEVVTWAEFDL